MEFKRGKDEFNEILSISSSSISTNDIKSLVLCPLININ